MEKGKLLYGLAPIGAYTVGRVAAGEIYEATYIDTAREKMKCADELVSLEDSSLPNSCSISDLEEKYADPASSKTEWQVIDGVLHRIESEDTEFESVSVILQDAETNLDNKLAARSDIEHSFGLASGGLVTAGIIVGSIAKWNINRKNGDDSDNFEVVDDEGEIFEEVETAESKSLVTRFLCKLGLAERGTPETA